MKVLVVLGGISAEREVSLRSGSNVIESLKRAGYSVSQYDPKIEGDLKDNLAGVDVVFPILHGRGGEDGEIQKQLEDIGVPFVGSSSTVSANCFNKITTQKIMDDVLFPKTEVVNKTTVNESELINKPYVLKPIDEGSSIDTFVVRDISKFDLSSIGDVFARHGEMMLQELIEGKELTAPVLIDKALPIIEIVPPKDQEFDYANKYNGATQEICPPVSISTNAQNKASEISLHIHQKMGCKSFTRSDFILTASGELYALEINTLPGMTKGSLFPKSAKAAGIDIKQLVDILVKDAQAK